MPGKRGRRIRPVVVSLLADHDPDASDFSRRPWKLVHPGGEPFSTQEAYLVNTATPAEGEAAQRLLLAGIARQGGQIRAHARLLELAGVDLRAGTEFSAAVAKLTPAEQAEVDHLLAVAYPDGPPPDIEREDVT